ncbi:TPA: hypothetical protein JLB63_004258 [Escherichia coli]|nr:hypothetical protein [Escherichia coli]HAV8112222.1 hypothetical protein [Escherichia coli]
MQQIADNRVCQVLTCLPEKFVVDFANGIDVAQEHIRTAGERTFFRRLKEGLTGEGAARQNAINASLAQGVEASLRWLTEMTTSLATTNYAITRSQLINSIDILRARRATGLMTRDNYRTVNNITLGKYPEAK